MRSVAICIGLLLLPSPLHAQEIEPATYGIDIACESDSQPTSVRLLSHDGEVIPAADRSSPGAPYKIQFRPDARAHFYFGTIEAKWNPNLTSDIGIRVQPAYPTRQTLFLYSPDITPSIDLIHNFSRRGYAGTNAFRTYFEAKSIYRQLHALHPKHTVTISAAYYWHEAARRLAGTSGSIIVMDPDAVDALKKVQTLLKDKELDSQVKHTLSVNEQQVGFALLQGQIVEWQHAAVVEWARAAGQLDTAIAVNDYYTTKWTNADKAERSAIIKYYRVDGDWLAKNDSYLQSLSAKMDAEAAPSAGE
jgi:hypothetical protein